MNWTHRVVILVTATVFGWWVLTQYEEPLPACDVTVNADGTWTPNGWDPYIDGIYGCELNTDNRFFLKWDGTWEVNVLP